MAIKKNKNSNFLENLLDPENQEANYIDREETIQKFGEEEKLKKASGQNHLNEKILNLVDPERKPIPEKKGKTSGYSQRETKVKKNKKYPLPEKYYKDGRLGVYLPATLMKKAKQYSIAENLSIEYIVTDALYEYMLKVGEIKNDEREKGQ